MPKLFLIIFLVFPSFGFSQDAIPQPARDLKSVMKEIGPIFRVISQTVADASKNPETIQNLKDLESLVYEALSLRPPMIASMPESKQRKAELRYLHLVLELQLAIVDAQTALLNSDQNTAQLAVKKMSTLRITGHGEFSE
ncbi:MAG: hypothetical protein V4596_08105 [Bdellovibrionota bacterium]